jgi:hypothetical protein
MTRRDEIVDWMLTELQAHGFDDTPENRLAFLQGLQQAWEEDTDVELEKILYQIALNGEIIVLQMRLRRLTP